MACKIADNKPLDTLRKDLGLPAQCHSSRGHCTMSRKTRDSKNSIMGGPGTAIGYCQGLFEKNGDAQSHTNHMTQKLKGINAPWFKSHELYWNYRKNEPVDEYIEGAIRPLLGEGRVPILITSLDPAKDKSIMEEILASSPLVVPGETILMRWSLNSDDSIEAAVPMIKNILKNVRTKNEMPKWWPLLQGSLSIEQWHKVKKMLGADWKHVNIAINPFSDHKMLTDFSSQVTVAQFVLGAKEGIYENGDVVVDDKVDLGLAKNGKKYNVFSYAERIKESQIMPMSIVCGPSLGWSDTDNQERIKKLMKLYKKATENLWHAASEKGREEILALPA